MSVRPWWEAQIQLIGAGCPTFVDANVTMECG